MRPRASRVESRWNLPGLGAVSPGRERRPRSAAREWRAADRLHELPSGRRLVSWPTADRARYHSGIRCASAPMGSRSSSTVHRGGFLYQNDSKSLRSGTQAPDSPSVRSWQARRIPSTLPPADRLLTHTNNLWLLRRAPDGQAMGSRVSPPEMPTRPDASGRSTVINHAIDARSACGRSPRRRSRSRGADRQSPTTARRDSTEKRRS